MTETLTLSLDPGPQRLWLNLPALRRTNTLVQGSTRAGKSYLVRWLCEQAFGQVQQLIFDVEGEYVSLTEKYDYALFSAETQVTPDPETAPLLMRRLLETGNSAIFDLSEMDSPAQQRFTAAAAAELVRASPKEPRSVLVVIDEAQRLAPQAGQGEAASTTQIRDLANRGLKRGLALVLATQRHSAVDAGLRGALANLVVGGTPPGPDMKSSGEKLGFSAAERRQLASLKAGEFFFLGPAFGDPDAGRAVQLARAGSVQTRHLDAGEARAFTPPPASEAVQSLYDLLGAEESLGAVKETMPVEAAVPRTAASAVPQPPKKPDALQVMTKPAACLETVQATPAPPAAEPALANQKASENLSEDALRRRQQQGREDDGSDGNSPSPQSAESAPLRVPAPEKAGSPARTLPADQAARLEATLAEFHPWALTPMQLTTLARVAMTEPQQSNLVRALRRKGVAGWDGARLTWTGSLRQPAPMTRAEYRRQWQRVLGTTASRLLDILEGEGGAQGLTWSQWLERAAYNPKGGGQMSQARTQLLAAGFVQHQAGRYRMTDAWPSEKGDGGAQPLLKIS